MAVPQKFQFDTIFDEETQVREEKKKEPEGPPLIHTEQDLIDAVETVRQETQASAFAEGRDAGIAEVRDAADVHATQALEAIAAALPGLAELRQNIARDARKDATELALLISSKLADALLQQHPAEQILRMISSALDEIGGDADKRVLVRVNPDLVEALTPRIEALHQSGGAIGELVLKADEKLEGSACTVEWAQGGADRDPATLQHEVEQAVHRYLNMIADLPEYQGETTVEGQPPESGEPGLASSLDALNDPADPAPDAGDGAENIPGDPETEPDLEPETGSAADGALAPESEDPMPSPNVDED